MEDDLMLRYKLHELISTKHMPPKQDTPIENPFVAREIARAQRIIEGENFEIRKTLRSYSFMVEEQRKILHHWRSNVLLDKEPLTLLAAVEPERYGKLLSTVGGAILNQVEKQITLFHIDQCWTEHLAYIAYIREGIHLLGFAGKNPSFEFQKMAIKAFDRLQQKVDERIIETFNAVTITETGIDAEQEGLMGPSSTWTYLINDNPFGNQMQSALIGSNAFAFQAAPWLMLFFPFILLGKVIKRFSRRAKN
jgi:preprotein translocase subunit SecA